MSRQAFPNPPQVLEPQAWLPGRPPGSVRYLESEASQLAAGAVLLYAGRFTAVKRLGWVVRTQAGRDRLGGSRIMAGR
jgi:hypothetical protein